MVGITSYSLCRVTLWTTSERKNDGGGGDMTEEQVASYSNKKVRYISVPISLASFCLFTLLYGLLGFAAIGRIYFTAMEIEI